MPNETAAIAELSHPSHSCLIYSTTQEQINVTCEFLARGLMRGEKCVFLESPERLAQVRAALAAAGVEVEAEEARGALVLTSAADFRDQDHFNGDRTIGFLVQTLQGALGQGFSALRATGDMNWELGPDQDYSVLVDYEAKLDAYVGKNRIVGLCQYRRHAISGLAICNALQTHQHVVLGQRLCANNLYYEPLEIRLDGDPAKTQEKRADWMCRRLNQAMQAERQRDTAVQALMQNSPGSVRNPPRTGAAQPPALDR